MTDEERRIIIFLKVYQRTYRTGAPWSLVRKSLGIPYHDHVRTMRRLKRRKMITFTDQPGSTFATKRGVQAALMKEAA